MPPRRDGTRMVLVSLHLPAQLLEEVDRLASRYAITRSEMLRILILAGLEKMRGERP